MTTRTVGRITPSGAALDAIVTVKARREERVQRGSAGRFERRLLAAPESAEPRRELSRRFANMERTALLRRLESSLAAEGAGSFSRRLKLWGRRAWSLAQALGKRLLDIIGASIGLVLLSPLFAVIAILIKLTDRGPVFYVANRVGKNGELFPFPKFRSMVTNADALKKRLAEQNQHGADGVTFKMKSDPRITWIGKILRRTSLDETPQLWCVLTGSMSLVGPRPPVPSEVERYSLADRRRLHATPGLTCTWQVSGRSEIPFERQVEMDVTYIVRRSLWLDLWLLFKTIPAVVTGRGAY